MQTLHIHLENRSYPIYIGEGLLSQMKLIESHLKQKHVAVVTNTTVAPLYLDPLLSLLKEHGIKAFPIILPDGESYKNQQTLNLIYDALLKEKCERTVTLIALGGGVIGDMTGYAAATYLRGVPFIQIPTTLLSQVDSSVGGKTGINHPMGKNMIGAFYQPQCVIADIDTLKTLPQREFSAGMAEVIKYGLIRDETFFNWLEKNIEGLMKLNPSLLIEAIERSCQNKADVVEIDEHESGVRATLNLGHTFGHAIENVMGYGVWLHGEAVAMGIVMAAHLSKLMGWVKDNEFNRIVKLLKEAKLPIDPPKISEGQYMELMSMDKKVVDGKIRLVLQKGIGDAVITSDYDAKHLKTTLQTLNFLA
jgi:3-dehydroquinate synthase